MTADGRYTREFRKTNRRQPMPRTLNSNKFELFAKLD